MLCRTDSEAQSTDLRRGSECYTVTMSPNKHNPNPAGRDGVPVSLRPLSFDEAVAGLAQVKPPEKKKPQAAPKKANG